MCQPYGVGYYKKLFHWKRDFKAKSELHFKDSILTVLCVEWIVRE